MLVATTSNDELYVITADKSRAELLQLKERTTFYCPQCKYPLQLKVGRIRTPHFAHGHKTACEQRFSERESEAHIAGKQDLYTFFKRLALDVELESVIPALQQRPDLLVHVNNRSYAIEFQCSRLPYEQFIARTTGYMRHHITPIWLLKSKVTLPSTVRKITLNDFERLFIQTYNDRHYLLTYNPLMKQFTYFNHLLHIYKNSYIASIQSIQMEQQTFPFYVPSALTEKQFEWQWRLYCQYRQSYLKSRLFYSKDGVQDLFLRGIYEMHLIREQLPVFIGVPVRNSASLPLYAAEWQLLLFYFLHLHHLTVSQFSSNRITHFLKWMKLPCTDEVITAVAHYLHLLQALQIEHPHTFIQPSILFHFLCGEFVAIR